MKEKIIIAISSLLLAMAFVFAGCAMEVADPINIVPLVDPYITGQPASALYTTGASAVAPLTVEIDEWEAKDGTLSYQWYTFDTIAEYLKGEVEEMGGATEAELVLPATIKKTQGARNYFYVVVTNTNRKATGSVKEASIQSDVAVIAFENAGTVLPVFTKQPSNAQTRFGRAVNPLSVRTQITPAGSVTYQWYHVTLDEAGEFTAIESDGYPCAALIDDATEAEFTPNFDQMKVGKNYFYVAASSSAVTVKSIPVIITVGKAVRAIAPVITAQPQPALYFSGDTIQSMTVVAESEDYGMLSYQWYSNTTATNRISGSTRLIEGKTTASFVPDVTQGQSLYYFVVVTNTNENVENETTAAVSSRAVNIRLTTAANDVTYLSTINLLPSTRYNYVRGYGGMEVAWANFPETFPWDTELMYDPDRLGFNMLRVMIPPGNTNIDIGMSDVVGSHRKHYYDNVKIVNKHGGYVAAAPWSPPKEWKSNNSINGGGVLIHSYYPQYAAYLKAYAQHMYNRGAPIYCISIQNEPNYTAGYDGCEWTGEEARDFFKEQGFFMNGVKGWGGGREIPRVLQMNGESANTVIWNHPVIDDALAYQYVDVFARHVYGERRTNIWETRPQVQRPTDGSKPKEVWMTEHNINSASAPAYPNDSTWDYVWRFMNDIDLVMRLNNENAFVWWAHKRFYSMIGDGQFRAPEGEALPRGWGLSHYAKYTIDMTRIGFQMSGEARTAGGAVTPIGTINTNNAAVVNGAGGDMDNTTARITAYATEDNSEISMVMWTPTNTGGSGGFNMETIRVTMPLVNVGTEQDAVMLPCTIKSVTGIRSTSATNVHQSYDVQVSADKTTAYITLNRSQMISVKFTLEQPVAPPPVEP